MNEAGKTNFEPGRIRHINKSSAPRINGESESFVKIGDYLSEARTNNAKTSLVAEP